MNELLFDCEKQNFPPIFRIGLYMNCGTLNKCVLDGQMIAYGH